MKVPTEIHQLSSAALDSKDEDISDLSCLESVEFGQKESVVKTEDFLYARVGSADWNVPRPRSKNTLQILDQSERRTIFDSDRWTDPVHSSTGTLHSLNGDVVGWKNEGFKRSQDHESGSISNSIESRINHESSSSSKTRLDLLGLSLVADTASPPSEVKAAATTIKKPNRNQTQKQPVYIHRRPILKRNKTPIRMQTQKQPVSRPRPRRANAARKEYVAGFHHLDVLFCPAAHSSRHPGNRWYRQQVEFHRVFYQTATTKKEKLTIVFDILTMIRARGGRILIQEESTLRWYLAHYTMAYIKVQKALQN
jgi:hypothetical protein